MALQTLLQQQEEQDSGDEEEEASDEANMILKELSPFPYVPVKSASLRKKAPSHAPLLPPSSDRNSTEVLDLRDLATQPN